MSLVFPRSSSRGSRQRRVVATDLWARRIFVEESERERQRDREREREGGGGGGVGGQGGADRT